MAEKRITVVDQERYDSGPFDFGESYTDGSLNRVIESLLRIRDSIPEEYRESARCEISSCGGYEGSTSATIEVTYNRPETPEEERARVAAEQAAILARDARDRAEFERLKQKFQ